MFNRSFWRLVSLAAAAGAGMFLVRSFRQQPIALPDKSGTTAVKLAARKVARRAAAKAAEEAGDGDGRRAH